MQRETRARTQTPRGAVFSVRWCILNHLEEGSIRTYNLALIGFGNVGQEFVRLLVTKESILRNEYGIAWKLTGVASRRIGWIADVNGLDPDAALALRWPHAQSSQRPRNVRDWLAAAKADVLFEASSLERHTGQPAIEHIQAALESGAHAISANKGPVVHAYHELRDLADARGRKFFFESAVMDGTPIFSMFPHCLPAVELRGFRGVLNATTNVVLTEMEKGATLGAAVKRAQEIGVAETDPSDDLDGWDAAVKVAALAIVLMGAKIKLSDVEVEGIRALTPELVRQAHSAGMRYKLVCGAERTASGIQLRVRPEKLPQTDALARLEGTTSAVRFDMDVFGLSLIEHKPGVIATAFGLFADFIRAVKS